MTPPAPEHGDRVGVPASPLDAIVAELAHGRSRAIVDYYYFGPKVEGLRHLVPRLSPGSRILEVGCGRGELGRALAHGDYEVTGVDIDAGSLEIAEARAAEVDPHPRPSYIRSDLHTLPFEDASFDALISVSVLQYVDWRGVIRECDRLLKPGGRAVFIENLDGSPFARAYRIVRRRFLGYPEHLTPRRHIAWDERGAFAEVFDTRVRVHNLLTPALLVFFAFGVRLPRIVTRMLVGSFHLLDVADGVLLRLAPSLAKRAWTITVLGTKPTQAPGNSELVNSR